MTLESSTRLTAPKNQERIEEIRTSTEVSVTASIRSPQIRRWLLREFNLVTSRLFLLTNTSKANKVQNKRLAGLLDDLVFSTSMLIEDCKYYKGEINNDIFPVEQYTLRLVSREATVIYKQLVLIDAAAASLYMSEFKGLIDKERRENILHEVTGALNAIKHVAIGYVPKTAEQLAAELQIG